MDMRNWFVVYWYDDARALGCNPFDTQEEAESWAESKVSPDLYKVEVVEEGRDNPCWFWGNPDYQEWQ